MYKGYFFKGIYNLIKISVHLLPLDKDCFPNQLTKAEWHANAGGKKKPNDFNVNTSTHTHIVIIYVKKYLL
jgi:hypothetical protein